MPGPFPVSGQSKSHIFGVVPTGKRGPTPGSAEYDTNLIATHVLKQNKSGMTTTYRKQTYEKVTPEGNRVHEVVIQPIARSKNLTVGELIGVILSYLLLTPIAGVLIHNAILSTKQLALPEESVHIVKPQGATPIQEVVIKVEVDEDGNIKGSQATQLSLLIGDEIDLATNATTEVKVFVMNPPGQAEQKVKWERPQDAAALADLEEEVTNTEADGYMKRDWKDALEISRAGAGETKGEEAKTSESLPMYVKQFVASRAFGGRHFPMAVTKDEQRPVVPVLVEAVDEDGQLCKNRSALPGKSSNVDVRFKDLGGGSYQITQEMDYHPELEGAKFGNHHYKTIVIISDGCQGGYQIESLKRTVTYTPPA